MFKCAHTEILIANTCNRERQNEKKNNVDDDEQSMVWKTTQRSRECVCVREKEGIIHSASLTNYFN